MLLTTIYILISIIYPDNNIDNTRSYNAMLDNVMQSYCWLDIEYNLTYDQSKADLIIYPSFDFYNDFDMLGSTSGNFLQNPNLFVTPIIRINFRLNKDIYIYILKHEICHFLGCGHSIDPNSLMYPFFTGENKNFSRTDSLELYNIYNNHQLKKNRPNGF